MPKQTITKTKYERLRELFVRMQQIHEQRVNAERAAAQIVGVEDQDPKGFWPDFGIFGDEMSNWTPDVDEALRRIGVEVEQ